MPSVRKALPWLVLVAVIGTIGAVWILLNPGNPFTRLFARQISDVNARIVIGPYPTEDDFRLLKANRVGLIVSLLDPAIPYEAHLLDREKALAEQAGIPLASFPMSSILGRRFGEAYDANAQRAAEAIARSPEKVYLHCYLGMHRIQVVRDRLAALGIEAGSYTVRQGERSDARRRIDAAEAAYAAGRYDDALGALSAVADADQTVDARLLKGWALLRLDRRADAEQAFAAAAAAAPGHAGAAVGLGYCALRSGNHDAATAHFSAALAAAPDHADALGGRGLAHVRAGRLAEGIADLEAALRQAPNPELQAALDRARAELAGKAGGTR